MQNRLNILNKYCLKIQISFYQQKYCFIKKSKNEMLRKEKLYSV